MRGNCWRPGSGFQKGFQSLRAINQYLDWHKDTFTMKTFTIELRVDYSDEEKNDVIKEAIKVAAKHVYTTALLISEKRKPQVAVHSSDFFAGTEEIELADDLPEE